MKPIMIRCAPNRDGKGGASYRRPWFQQIGPRCWICKVNERGAMIGRGETKQEAADDLQADLDALYERAGAYMGGWND